MKIQKSLPAFSLSNTVLVLIMALLALFFLIPFIHVVSVSLSDATRLRPGLMLFPKNLTFSAYAASFQTSNILVGIKNSVLRSILGTASILLVNLMAAYVISKDDMIGVRFLRKYFIFTMYFSGGIIPVYLLMRSLSLTGSFLVYIFPMIVTPFYMVLLKTYMQSIPKSMEEAALMDGAGYFRIFSTIILPLSRPAVAAVGLFSIINHWNAITDTAIYNSMNKEYYTLQYVLYTMLQQSSVSLEQAKDALHIVDVNSLTLRMAITAITMIPVLVIYPSMQRYFVTGLMVGAVKA